MKNLSELSDEQKSVMLARLCGWRKEWIDSKSLVLLDADGRGVGYRLMHSGEQPPNLYDTANMALAWIVLNWAEDKAAEDTHSDFHFGWMEFLPESLFSNSPEDAQREWLDKILSLADETGMLEEQNAND